MMRCVYVSEDGYLMEHTDDADSPIICWGDGTRLCCDCCAAFRVEMHLDSSSGTSKDAEFVHCVALGDRGLAIGRIDGN